MALTTDRMTAKRDGCFVPHPVAANKTIYAGALVVLNASGYAEPGKTATGLTAVGKAGKQADNYTATDGKVLVLVERGIFLYANTAADAITRTEIGKSCYIINDYSVAKTNGTGTRSIAGKVIDVTNEGVWVELG